MEVMAGRVCRQTPRRCQPGIVRTGALRGVDPTLWRHARLLPLRLRPPAGRRLCRPGRRRGRGADAQARQRLRAEAARWPAGRRASAHASGRAHTRGPARCAHPPARTAGEAAGHQRSGSCEVESVAPTASATGRSGCTSAAASTTSADAGSTSTATAAQARPKNSQALPAAQRHHHALFVQFGVEPGVMVFQRHRLSRPQVAGQVGTGVEAQAFEQFLAGRFADRPLRTRGVAAGLRQGGVALDRRRPSRCGRQVAGRRQHGEQQHGKNTDGRHRGSPGGIRSLRIIPDSAPGRAGTGALPAARPLA